MNFILFHWSIELNKYRMPYSSLRLDNSLHTVNCLPIFIICPSFEIINELKISHYPHKRFFFSIT